MNFASVIFTAMQARQVISSLQLSGDLHRT